MKALRSSRTIAVFGGSFNPPHVAHVLAVSLVLSIEAIDEVLVVPTFQHPFAKSLAAFEHRVRMCELAMGWIAGVRVSRVEEELGGESLTLRTLQRLKADHPNDQFRLVIGTDVLGETSKWFRFDEVAAIAPPLVLSRRGSPVADDSARLSPALLPEISSTEIRRKLAARDFESLHSLVPRRVLEYIQAEKLYT